MSLLELWHSNPSQFGSYKIRQIVAFAGDGKMRDSSTCSAELCAFLQEVDSESLGRFTEECLTEGFEDSGLVLQDVINEIGRRLEFKVENGLYRGKSNAVGFDGIWTSQGAGALIVEVKTTDLYNVKLDAVAGYRRKLMESGTVSPDAAVLFVVGRQDTGSLEAQIRGSRHAWTMRVVGAESLLRLMRLKEKSTSGNVVKRIQALLQPVEYTRIDGIADLMFDATADVELGAEEATPIEALAGAQKKQATTDHALIESMRIAAVKALGDKLGTVLLKKRKASFASADDLVRAVVAVSKRYGNQSEPYWYAYHPSQDEFLDAAHEGFLVLGCADSGDSYAVPVGVIRSVLPKMNQTVSDDRQYWHVKGRPVDGKYNLVLKGELFPIDGYRLA